MKISIIMPVFNASRYLNKALDSVIQQTLQSWELIAIDDGSKDSSGAILDKYALGDSRIRVVHQSNHGVAATRQLGVSLAQGDYCIHIDSDDWVEPDYLSSLLHKVEESDADMVWCDCFVDEDSIWRMPCAEDADAMIRGILTQKYWGSLCNRLIKTGICQDINIKFPDCTMWEDMAFLVQNLQLCKRIVYLPRALYHYRMNLDSLTHTQSLKDISAEHRKAINSIYSFLQKEGHINKYIYELRGLQLFAIRDFIDDKRFLDYNAFLNTYPEAIAHINEYPDYPWRLKSSAWLLQHRLAWFVPVVCRIDGVLRRLGLSKQV